MKTCKHCGGIITLEDGETYAGSPQAFCKCSTAVHGSGEISLPQVMTFGPFDLEPVHVKLVRLEEENKVLKDQIQAKDKAGWLVDMKNHQEREGLQKENEELKFRLGGKNREGHSGDCHIYASLINGNPEDGICTCGYGLQLIRQGEWSQLHSKERSSRELAMPQDASNADDKIKSLGDELDAMPDWEAMYNEAVADFKRLQGIFASTEKMLVNSTKSVIELEDKLKCEEGESQILRKEYAKECDRADQLEDLYINTEKKLTEAFEKLRVKEECRRKEQSELMKRLSLAEKVVEAARVQCELYGPETSIDLAREICVYDASLGTSVNTESQEKE